MCHLRMNNAVLTGTVKKTMRCRTGPHSVTSHRKVRNSVLHGPVDRDRTSHGGANSSVPAR